MTGAFGFFFPRPAFEIWLPLPSLLGLLPMLVAGSTAYAATLPVAAVAGRARAGGRLADRRRRRRGARRSLAERSRTLALGAGPRGRRSRCRSSSPRPTWTRRTRSPSRPSLACLLMVRLVRRPPERLLDARLVGLGLAIGDRGPGPQRGGLGGRWRGPSSPPGRLRGRGAGTVVRAIAVPGVVAVAVMAPWLVRNWLVVRLAPAGPGDHERLGDHGQRDLRLAGPGDGRRLPGPGPGRLAGAPGRRVRPQPAVRAPGPGRARWRSSGSSPCRGRRDSAPCGRSLVLALITFLVDDARLPGPDALGDVPPRVGPGRGPPPRGRPRRPGRGAGLGGPAAGLDAPGGLAGPALRRRWAPSCSWCRASSPTAARRAARRPPTRTWAGGWRRPASPSTEPPRSSPTTRSGSRRSTASPPWPCPTSRWRAWSTSPATFGARLVILDGEHGGWPDRLAGDPDAACLVPVALPPPAAGRRDGDDFRVFRVACP